MSGSLPSSSMAAAPRDPYETARIANDCYLTACCDALVTDELGPAAARGDFVWISPPFKLTVNGGASTALAALTPPSAPTQTPTTTGKPYASLNVGAALAVIDRLHALPVGYVADVVDVNATAVIVVTGDVRRAWQRSRALAPQFAGRKLRLRVSWWRGPGEPRGHACIIV